MAQHHSRKKGRKAGGITRIPIRCATPRSPREKTKKKKKKTLPAPAKSRQGNERPKSLVRLKHWMQIAVHQETRCTTPYLDRFFTMSVGLRPFFPFQKKREKNPRGPH